MDLAVRLSFASDSIGRGFKDAFLSTQFRHGLHNPMVAVAATAPQSLYRGAVRLQSKAARLVSVHGNKIADENGDAKHFFLLCSVRSTHEGEQAASPSAPARASFVASSSSARITMKRLSIFEARSASGGGALLYDIDKQDHATLASLNCYVVGFSSKTWKCPLGRQSHTLLRISP